MTIAWTMRQNPSVHTFVAMDSRNLTRHSRESNRAKGVGRKVERVR